MLDFLYSSTGEYSNSDIKTDDFLIDLHNYKVRTRDKDLYFSRLSDLYEDNNSSLGLSTKGAYRLYEMITTAIGDISTGAATAMHMNASINYLFNTYAKDSDLQNTIANVSANTEHISSLDASTLFIQNNYLTLERADEINNDVSAKFTQSKNDVSAAISNISYEMNIITQSLQRQIEETNQTLDEVLDTSYFNETSEYTKDNISTIGTALDCIIYKMFYQKPSPISVLTSITPQSFVYGMDTSVVFSFQINNYRDNIGNITFGDKTLTIDDLDEDYSYSETVRTATTASRVLSITSNYKDAFGASPEPYSTTMSKSGTWMYCYWLSADKSFDDAENISPATLLQKGIVPKEYKYSSSGASINFDSSSIGERYLYFIYKEKKSQFWIYAHNTSPFLEGGVDYLGKITYKVGSTDLEYHLYRTTNALQANMDVKF